MSHIPWPEIENFHNVRRAVTKYPELLQDNSKVSYVAKVKLHGTNAAIQVRPGGKVFAQSRTSIIGTGNDNNGFAKFVEETKEFWSSLGDPSPEDTVAGPDTYTFFGEWIGRGIQSKVACSQIPEKQFAIFGLLVSDFSRGFSKFVFYPQHIEDYLRDGNIELPKNVQVLPLYTHEDGSPFSLEVDWTLESSELEKAVAEANREVERVEKCDPWVKDKFGISGIGEGLVFYPISKGHLTWKAFGDLCFKAKGEEHKVVNQKKPIVVDAEKAKSIQDFADLVVTPARLEQGFQAIGATERGDPRMIGPFLAWVCKDVEKETRAELEASGFLWRDVAGAISKKAKEWLMTPAQ